MRAAGERALVLGGGGSTGNAWLIGVIAGLFDARLDVTTADLTIGTSAGSTAAAQIAGATPTDLLAAILAWLAEELLDADSVALIYDEVEGLNHYRDFGRLDALFAHPTLARDRTNLAPLREYLHDESVSPLAIRRLVQRHPDGADPAFRALLRKPGFSWPRDGEKLLRRHKKPFYDREPTPSISIIGERLAELLRTTR